MVFKASLNFFIVRLFFSKRFISLVKVVIFFFVFYKKSIDILIFLISIFSVFIQVINLQSNQNPDHNKENFANGIKEVVANFALFDEFLADVSEEFYHKVSLLQINSHDGLIEIF